MKRVCFFAVVFTALLSSISFGATYGGGAGTAENPYQIWTPQQMNTIGIDPNDWDNHFKLMADINMSAYTGIQYKIIGNFTTKFTGSFDGNHHAIRNLNYTTTSAVNYIGVFGCCYNATIKDLGVENITFSTEGYSVGGLAGSLDSCSVTHCYTMGTISTSFTTPGCYAGGLAGWQKYGSIADCYSTAAVTAFSSSSSSHAGGLVAVQYYGSIERCHSTGTANSSSSASSSSSNAGGLVGYQAHGSIVDSFSTGSASSSCLGSSSRSYAGGLVGYQAGESITGSYSTGAVSSTSDYHSFAGGLVGEQFGDFILLHNCYSTGSVTCSSTNASSYSVAGGLVGDQTSGIISICYSTGTVQTSGLAKTLKGGLVGHGGAVINSFWDIETSGLESSAGGIGRTTAQMKQSANYIAWNTPTQTYWTIDEDVDYPRLSWENQPGTPLAAQVFSDLIPGAGTPSDPYRISTPQQLNIIGLFADQWDKVFRLENDIDLSVLSGAEYNRIGVKYGNCFTGTFDGCGYVISNLTYRTTSAIYDVGLFGFTSNAEIRNIDITNIDILTGGSNVGGLAGYQFGGSITNCSVTGTVACSSVMDSHVGGLVGELDGGGSAMGCVSGVSVSCICSGTSSSWAGGLVGEVDESGALTNCISTGDVYSSASNSYAGGLVGASDGPMNNCCSTGAVNASSSSSYSRAGGVAGLVNYNTLTNCYSTGSVNSNSPSSNAYAGGLIGYMAQDITKVKNCYSGGSVGATGKTIYQGGFLGYKSGVGAITACFWDKDTSGRTSGVGSGSSTGITGKTTVQMQTLLTFTSAGWDFTNETANGTNNYWRMCADWVDYPRLNWESIGDFTCPDGVAIEDLDYFVGRWLLENCTSANNYCSGADMDSSGKVDLTDWAIFARQWLEGI